MISYLLNSIICAGFCWICYVVLFQSEKMHQFNRYYLLASLALSILIPLIRVDLPALYPTAENNLEIPYIIGRQTAVAKETGPTLPYTVLLIIYLVISSWFAIRLIQGLRQLYLQIKRSRVLPINGMQIVLNKHQKASYSFFNYLFIASEDLHTGIPTKKQITIPGSQAYIDSVIWEHETAHARQWHSLDILLLEILKIICWFNPFVYLFKRAIQLNHEFLADEKVIRTGQPVSTYQELLLSKLTIEAPPLIVSSSVFSITKKRFIMMTQKTSRQKAGWLKLSALPILGICLFAFSNRSTGQDIKKGKLVEVNVQDTNGGISQSKFDYYQQQIEKMRVIKGKDTIYSIQKLGGPENANKLISLYQKMSPAQKSKVNSIAPPPPPPPPAPKDNDRKNQPTPPPPPPKVEKVSIEPKVEQVKSPVNKTFPEPRVEKVKKADKKEIQFSTPTTKDKEAKAGPKKVIKFTLLQDVKVKPTAETGTTEGKQTDHTLQIKGDVNTRP